MTYEQLKEHADNLGYRLVKKERLSIMPCLCGAKRGINTWWATGSGERFLRCSKCDLTGPRAKTEKQAKIEWNQMIESRKNEVRNAPTD